MRLKNIFIVVSVLGLILMLGCSQQESNQSGTDETLSNSETVVSDMIQVEVMGEKVELVKGYEKFVLNEALGDEGWFYVPYISSRIPGVTYYMDDERDWYTMNIYNELNRPQGTVATKISANGFFESHITQPPFYRGVKVNNPTMLVLEGYDAYSNTQDRYENVLADNMDIRAVSLALYEDFYEDIPQLTVNIYGIGRALWNKYVGDKETFYAGDYNKLLEACKNSNYSNCQLISTKNVSKTGVYYIDYKAMAEKGDFVQYIVEFKFDKSIEYTYYIYGHDVYSVTSDAEYQVWKQENKDKFISFDD